MVRTPGTHTIRVGTVMRSASDLIVAPLYYKTLGHRVYRVVVLAGMVVSVATAVGRSGSDIDQFRSFDRVVIGY